MEEKKFSESHSSLRSFFSFRRHYQSFLGQSNLYLRFKTPRVLIKKGWFSGFTLVELLIVISILSILTALLLLTLNPMTQIQKGQDAKRQQDLKEINTALDTYYNDHNYYPATLTELSAGMYIKKVPSDPQSANGWQDYDYVTDGAAHPQWNVIFAKVNFPNPNCPASVDRSSCSKSSLTACPLEQTNCFPGDGAGGDAAGYNYCALSGSVSCLKGVKLTPIVGGGVASTPVPGPTNTTAPVQPTSTPVPTVATPTLVPCLCGSAQASWVQDGALCDGVVAGTGNFCNHSGNQCINPCQ